MLNIDLVMPVLILGITVFIFVTILYKLANWIFKGSKSSSNLLSALILIFILYNLSIAQYPNYTSSKSTLGVVERTYDPKESKTIIKINKWHHITNVGWVYFNRIDTVDNKQLRLYYRTLGIFDNDLYDSSNVVLVDNLENEYKTDGAAFHKAIFFDAGTIEFYTQSKAGSEFNLIINGHKLTFK